MKPDDFFFSRDDFFKNSIRDLRWLTFDHLKFLDIALLSQKLQVQSSRFHKLQQLTSLYGYKKLKL